MISNWDEVEIAQRLLIKTNVSRHKRPTERERRHHPLPLAPNPSCSSAQDNVRGGT